MAQRQSEKKLLIIRSRSKGRGRVVRSNGKLSVKAGYKIEQEIVCILNRNHSSQGQLLREAVLKSFPKPFDTAFSLRGTSEGMIDTEVSE